MRSPQDFDAPHWKQRRHRRFDLEFPVALSFPSGSAVRELAGISRNISIGGLLLSQLLTLYTTPIVSLFFDRLARRFGVNPSRGVLGDKELVGVGWIS